MALDWSARLMDTSILLFVGALLVFLVALFSITIVLYHWWFVVTGVRRDKVLTASLLGPICLLMPSLFFEEKAQEHLRRLNPWLIAAAVSFLLLFGFCLLAGHRF
jgi:hypothetical protein